MIMGKMYRAAVLALAVMPLARGDYSYSYDAPTMAPTTSTMTPTVTVAPTRSDVRAVARDRGAVPRCVEAIHATLSPNWVDFHTGPTRRPQIRTRPLSARVRRWLPGPRPLDTTGLPPCTDVGLGLGARCVANSVEIAATTTWPHEI